MSAPIARRTRKIAAQLCSMAACTSTGRTSIWISEAADAIDAPPDAYRLAWDALEAGLYEIVTGDVEWYAEAEAKLRAGWSPRRGAE